MHDLCRQNAIWLWSFFVLALFHSPYCGVRVDDTEINVTETVRLAAITGLSRRRRRRAHDSLESAPAPASKGETCPSAGSDANGPFGPEHFVGDFAWKCKGSDNGLKATHVGDNCQVECGKPGYLPVYASVAGCVVGDRYGQPKWDVPITCAKEGEMIFIGVPEGAIPQSDMWFKCDSLFGSNEHCYEKKWCCCKNGLTIDTRMAHENLHNTRQKLKTVQILARDVESNASSAGVPQGKDKSSSQHSYNAMIILVMFFVVDFRTWV